MDTYLALDLPAGLYKNGTRYQAQGRWYDGSGYRFFSGTIQPIGGWAPLLSSNGAQFSSLEGEPRGVLTWEKDDGKFSIALATTEKLYVIDEGTRYDITPVGFVGMATDATQTDTSVSLYGDGLYGEGRYGGAGSGTAQILRAGVWQIDNFGDFLLGVATDEETLYVWAADPNTVADVAAGAPSCTGVVVTPERFVFALGADGNVRNVAWASQETFTDWSPLDTNSAGAFELPTNGRLVCGLRSRAQTLLWTNVDAWTATYIGDPFIYRFDLIGSNCGIISPRGALVIDTMAVWMGQNNFFLYDGFTKPLPCEVHDAVFSDFNTVQASKVWAMTISAFGEAWWFYPSKLSTEIDRAVVWNYRENHWTLHRLARAAGVDAGATPYPLMLGVGGEMWQHEFGQSRPGFTPFLESGPVELSGTPGQGDRIMDIQRVVPDEANAGEASVTLKTALFPTDAERTHGPYPTSQPTWTRAKGRTVRLVLTETAAGAGRSSRIGTFRLGIVPSSRR